MPLGAITDPEWAIPVQTFLLIVLAVVTAVIGARSARKTDNVHKEVVDVKRAVGANKRSTDEAPKPTPPETADVLGLVGRRHTDPPQ